MVVYFDTETSESLLLASERGEIYHFRLNSPSIRIGSEKNQVDPLLLLRKYFVNFLLLFDKYEYKQIIRICINCIVSRAVSNLIWFVYRTPPPSIIS